MAKALKLIVFVLVVGIAGTVIYAAAPVFTIEMDVRSQVREKVSYLDRGLNGQKLTRAVIAELQKISLPGAIENLAIENDNGRITVSFHFDHDVKVGEYKLFTTNHEILVENVKMARRR